jgi:hypothetical protein
VVTLLLASDIAEALDTVRNGRDLALAQADLAVAQWEAGQNPSFSMDSARREVVRAFRGYDQLQRSRSHEAFQARAAWKEAQRAVDDAERAMTGRQRATYEDRRDDAMHEREERRGGGR